MSIYSLIERWADEKEDGGRHGESFNLIDQLQPYIGTFL